MIVLAARTAALATVLVLALTPAAAQETPNLIGSWAITMDASAPVVVQGGKEMAPTCLFRGVVRVDDQMGAGFSGTSAVSLEKGDSEICPSSMSADFTGSLVSDQKAAGATKVTLAMIVGGLFGDLGQADFNGSLDDSGVIDGTWSVPPEETLRGPAKQFGGFSGNWTAQRQAAVVEIPALGPSGLALLIFLLGMVALALLLRRRGARAA